MVTICGIVGFVSNNATSADLEVLKRVLIESRIRGKHASGIAWSDGIELYSYVKSIPIDELVNQFDLNDINVNGKVSMIAHTRYSTSDIRYNQPIVGDSMAIAHNGVITQADYDTWESQYGYKCSTHNDSELLLRCQEDGRDPYEVFPGSSFAALFLSRGGKLTLMRNGLRPLWVGTIGDGFVCASTYDILRRAGVTDITRYHTSDQQDLQRRDWTSWENSKRV